LGDVAQTAGEKANEMCIRLLPSRQCRWCGNDLKAGELFCKACRGNRLVPARWWPVMAAGMLVGAVTLFAMGIVLIATWRMDGAPAANAPVAQTPAPAETAGRMVSPLPTMSAALAPRQDATPTRPPTSTPEPTSTATLEPTATATLEPTATPEPTHTPTLAPTDTPTPEPTSTATLEPTETATPTPIWVPDPGFRADRTTLTAGECTILHWDVDGVRAVFLDGAGRPGHSSEEICPTVSQTYTLRVVTPDGHEASHSIYIRVLGYVPLTLNVFVRNRFCDTAESYGAEIAVWAEGGDGWYTYYRDDLDHQIAGPTRGGLVYQISWRTCGGAPGTFIVRSGDGQEARESYWVEPPDCCYGG
jgi:hypothetical protein